MNRLNSDCEPIVYVVHCVDAEGPLYESLKATFERIHQIFGIKLRPSGATLRKLQAREIDLGGQTEAVARVVAPQLLEYNDNWNKIEAMLERIGSDAFRYALPDSDGGGWIYNWHCVDHVGYTENPRRKSLGYHKIFDYYRRFIAETGSPDGLHWHFHPAHPSGRSHQSATSYLRDMNFFDILTRRVIERNWFPSVNRAGFHTERPDSHWLLEQWIPFDLSNQAVDEDVRENDLSNGRFGDWRRAVKDWSIYNPCHDDYQVPGNCRRFIGRCLNVGTRLRLLDEAEVRQAFQRARDIKPTLLAFTDHDFRDIGKDVDYVREMLRSVKREFPEVRFKYCEAREAMNRAIFGDYREPEANILNIDLEPGATLGTVYLSVSSDEPIFGPQPYLAIRTKEGEYYTDNFDIQEPFNRWTYVFDDITFPPESLDRVAVAANDLRGFNHIKQINSDELQQGHIACLTAQF